MYLTIEQTAEYLHLSIDDIHRLIRERQIRYVVVDEELLIYREQFALFLRAREDYWRKVAEELAQPLPEDPDIKDED